MFRNLICSHITHTFYLFWHFLCIQNLKKINAGFIFYALSGNMRFHSKTANIFAISGNTQTIVGENMAISIYLTTYPLQDVHFIIIIVCLFLCKMPHFKLLAHFHVVPVNEILRPRNY